jgi:hypothetical protein
MTGSTFAEAFDLLYVFQWWNTMMESEQHEHLKKIAAFCQAHEGLARRMKEQRAIDCGEGNHAARLHGTQYVCVVCGAAVHHSETPEEE